MVTGDLVYDANNQQLINLAGLGYSFAGFMCAIPSILFFVASSKNKRKIPTVVFRYQKPIMPDFGSVVVKPQPALSIKFNF